jgi:hypothetical protein
LLGEFTVANNGTASITGWELSAAFAGDEIQVTGDPVEPDYGGGTIVMEAQPDWPAIPPGDSESGYFIAEGSTLTPSDCTFNGFACSDFPDQAQDQGTGLSLIAYRLQFLAEQVHQQPVMELAVGPALVAAHHADRAEADLLIAPDRPLVGRRRVDGQPVVPSLLA